MVDAELAFEAGLRCLLGGEFHHDRRHHEVDRLDHVGGECVFGRQLDAAVDHAMDHQPAGERLVHVVRQFPGLAQSLGDHRRVELRRHHMREAALRFDRLLGTGEALLRHQRGHQAAVRGPARMEALAHRAEHLAQPGRLRGGDAQCPAHLPLVEPEQLAGGGGRAEDAGGAGDVPADLVVFRKHRQPDAALGLDTEHERVQQPLSADRPDAGQRPRPIAALRTGARDRQQRRPDRRARMDRAGVRVVVVEHMRADAVQQCRMQHVDLLVPAVQRRHRRTEAGCEPAQRIADRVGLRTADRAAHPVDQCARGFVVERRRYRVRRAVDDEPCQRACDVVHGLPFTRRGSARP